MARRRFTENMRRCPDCKRDISRSATNCPLCGCDVVLRDEINKRNRLIEDTTWLKQRGFDTAGLTADEIGLKKIREWGKELETEENREENKKNQEKNRKLLEKKALSVGVAFNTQTTNKQLRSMIREKEKELKKKRYQEELAEAKKKGMTIQQYRDQKFKRDSIGCFIIFVIIILISYC